MNLLLKSIKIIILKVIHLKSLKWHKEHIRKVPDLNVTQHLRDHRYGKCTVSLLTMKRKKL